MTRRLAAFFLILGITAAPLLAVKFPSSQGRVNDFAGILKASSRKEIQDTSAAVDQTTTAELVVVTVRSLSGLSVEDYANRLFKQWGIGKKGKDNGVLILVATQEHRIRVEVGYGLESVLPDGLAGQIIREQMKPAFKRGDYNRGILDAVGRVSDILTDSSVAPSGGPAHRDPYLAKPTRPSGIGVVSFLSVFVVIGFFMVGVGLGSKTGNPIVFGSLYGGIPLLMGFLGHWIDPSSRGTPFSWILILIAASASHFGIRIGRKPKNFLNNSKLTGARSDGWTWGSADSGGSSGGLGGGFDGGSSGGGGASGSW